MQKIGNSRTDIIQPDGQELYRKLSIMEKVTGNVLIRDQAYYCMIEIYSHREKTVNLQDRDECNLNHKLLRHFA